MRELSVLSSVLPPFDKVRPPLLEDRHVIVSLLISAPLFFVFPMKRSFSPLMKRRVCVDCQDLWDRLKLNSLSLNRPFLPSLICCGSYLNLHVVYGRRVILVLSRSEGQKIFDLIHHLYLRRSAVARPWNKRPVILQNQRLTVRLLRFDQQHKSPECAAKSSSAVAEKAVFH